MNIQPPKPLPQGNGYFVLVGDCRYDFKGKHAYKDSKRFYKDQVYYHTEVPASPPSALESLLSELRGTFGDIKNHTHKPDWVTDWSDEAIAKIDSYLRGAGL